MKFSGDREREITQLAYNVGKISVFNQFRCDAGQRRGDVKSKSKPDVVFKSDSRIEVVNQLTIIFIQITTNTRHDILV